MSKTYAEQLCFSGKNISTISLDLTTFLHYCEYFAIMYGCPGIVVLELKAFRISRYRRRLFFSYWALTEHFSLVVKSSLSRLSSSRFLSRMRLADRSPPKSSSLPGDTRRFSHGNSHISQIGELLLIPLAKNRQIRLTPKHAFIYFTSQIWLKTPAFVFTSIWPHEQECCCIKFIVTSINLLLIIDFHDDKLLTHGKCGKSGGDELAKPVRWKTKRKVLCLVSAPQFSGTSHSSVSGRSLPLVDIGMSEHVFTAAGHMGWGSPAAADWARCWWQLQSVGTVRCLSGSAAVWGSAGTPSAVWHF